MSRLTRNLYRFDEFSLDVQSRVLRRGGTAVPLTRKAFDVLLTLIQNAGRIVSKDELMKAVWPDSFVEESNLTQTIFMVRKALEETSDRRYILNVQGQGYRFLVPVTEEAVQGPEMEAPEPPPTAVTELPEHEHTRRATGWRGAVVAFSVVTAVLVLIVAAIIWLWRPRHGIAEVPDKIMLAVLPFENFTGDPGQDYFSDGLTEEMISQLGNLDPTHLGVIARTSVMHYKHSPASIPQIGNDLGVQYVIEGSVRRDSERVRITAQLILVKDQSHLWARQYDRDLGHLLELQGEIARAVANEIEFSLSGRRPIVAAGEAASGAKSYEAYDFYLKGRYFWNKRTEEGFQQAAVYFQRAIDKDPNYARAYAGLADTYGLMSTWYMVPQNEFMPKARAAAERAVEIDEGLAEAHASLGLIAENYDYDWVRAEKEFRRAIELNPQYATAHQWYAEFLAWQGRFEEAFAESEQARQLDPMSLIIATDHAVILYYSRQYDRAIAQCRAVLDMDPSFESARTFIARSYEEEGKYAEALAEIDRWRRPSLWTWAERTYVYSRRGRTEEARQSLAKFEKSTPPPSANPTTATLVAYLGIEGHDQVIGRLERAYAEHSNAVVQIKVDPMYDPIRNDSRFADLVRRLRLE